MTCFKYASVKRAPGGRAKSDRASSSGLPELQRPLATGDAQPPRYLTIVWVVLVLLGALFLCQLLGQKGSRATSLCRGTPSHRRTTVANVANIRKP